MAKQTMPPDEYERMIEQMRAVVERVVRADAEAVAYGAEYLELTGRISSDGP